MSLKTNTISVNAVSDLFSTKPANGDRLQTLGYSGIGDGGDNLYIYEADSSETPDGGFTLPGVGGSLSFDDSGVFDGTAGNGRFISVNKSEINLRNWGIKGDSSDESLSLNRVLDAALLNEVVIKGDSLNVTLGEEWVTYTVTGLLQIIGDNLTFTLSNLTAFDAFLDYSGTSPVIKLEGVSFVGPGEVEDTSFIRGFSEASSPKFIAKNCNFSQCERGINLFEGGGANSFVSISDCEFFDLSFGVFVSSNEIETINITNNDFHDIGRSTTTGSVEAIRVGKTAASQSDFLEDAKAIIGFNSVRDVNNGLANTGEVKGISNYYPNSSIVSNQVSSITTTDTAQSECEGIYSKGYSCNIANNTIKGSVGGEGCLTVKGGLYSSVTGNTVEFEESGYDQRGIYISSGGAVVSQNIVRGSGSLITGISIVGSTILKDGFVLSSNLINGASQYGLTITNCSDVDVSSNIVELRDDSKSVSTGILITNSDGSYLMSNVNVHHNTINGVYGSTRGEGISLNRGSDLKNIVIANNNILDVTWGIYVPASTEDVLGLKILDNIIADKTFAGEIHGMRIYSVSNLEVRRNTLKNLVATTTNNVRGIQILSQISTTTNDRVSITDNFIENVHNNGNTSNTRAYAIVTTSGIVDEIEFSRNIADGSYHGVEWTTSDQPLLAIVEDNRIYNATDPYEINASTNLNTWFKNSSENIIQTDVSRVDVINVKDYGARGDGSTDDTSAIQSAITAGGVGSAIYVPKGTFVLSEKLTLLEQQRLYGDGIGSILQWSSNSDDYNLELDDYNVVQDLKIDGNGKTGGKVGIAIIGEEGVDTISRGRIENVSIVECQVGIALNGCHVWDISDCNISTCTSGIHFGYGWVDSDTETVNSVNVVGGEIQNCGVGVTFSGQGNSVHIFGVAIEANDNYGIHSLTNNTAAWMAVSIRNCYFESNGIASIYFEDFMRFPEIVSCHFSGGASQSQPIIIGGAVDTSGRPIGTRIEQNTYNGTTAPEATITINAEAEDTFVQWHRKQWIGSAGQKLFIEDSGVSTTISEAWAGSDLINVRDYGARGDGSTDDTSAIQAAIVAGDESKMVLFPAGDYLVSSPIHFHPYGSYRGTGTSLRRYAANDISITSSYSGTEPAFTCDAEGEHDVGNGIGIRPSFNELTFVRNNESGTNFYVNDIHNGIFNSVNFFGGSILFNLHSNDVGTWQNSFNQCRFFGPNSSNNRVGLQLDYEGNTSPNENWFSQCFFVGNGKSLVINDGDRNIFAQCEFSKAYVPDGSGHGCIELSSTATNTEFISCRFEQNLAHSGANIIKNDGENTKIFGGTLTSSTIPSNLYIGGSGTDLTSIGCINQLDIRQGGIMPVFSDGVYDEREPTNKSYELNTLDSVTLTGTSDVMKVTPASVANSGELPVSGDFVGQRNFVDAEGTIYEWDGGSWNDTGFSGAEGQVETITATNRAGAQLTIILGANTQFVDVDGNLRLAGSADVTLGVTDTIQLVCDGINWFETGRSNN